MAPSWLPLALSVVLAASQQRAVGAFVPCCGLRLGAAPTTPGSSCCTTSTDGSSSSSSSCCSRRGARVPSCMYAASESFSAPGPHQLDGQTTEGPLQPLMDTVVVEKYKFAEQTSGGLFLPGKAKKASNMGTVIVTGPGKRAFSSLITLPMKAKAGQTVMWGEVEGKDMEYDGTDYRLLRDDDILLAFEGDEPTLEAAVPLGEKVLVKVVKEIEQERATGIIIAATSAKVTLPTTGEIVKQGPGRVAINGEAIPMHAKPGDKIRFRQYAGKTVELKGGTDPTEGFVVIKNNDIFGTI